MKLPELARSARILALLMASACGHSDPFGAERFDTDQPFNPSPPVRITVNHGADRRAAWLPDRSAILYSTQLETLDHDVCLAVLPPQGGRQRSLTCELVPTGEQLTEAIESAAPASDGRLAFSVATSGIGALTPTIQGLALGTVADPTQYQTLVGLPTTGSTGRLIGGVSQIHWLGEEQLFDLAGMVVVRPPCNGCEFDTLRSGLEANLLAVDQAGASPQFIPGTDFASGVSPGSSEDEIYYTLGGDSRVYRRQLSTGEVTVAFDFGAAGIARDVHVVGNEMAAIVGGRVTFGVDPSLGPFQWDSGGTLHIVSLTIGGESVLDGPGLFRRPRLSPSGGAVVAEVYPLIITTNEIGADTTVARTSDLYLIGQP